MTDRDRWSWLGASLQAAVPGTYAWAVTVVPFAWARGAGSIGMLAKAGALVGLFALWTAPVVDVSRRFSSRTPERLHPWLRAWSFWGFVLASVLVWGLVPVLRATTKIDAIRGVFGVVGWLLFAFASAGPSLEKKRDATFAPLRLDVDTPPAVASKTARGSRGDLVYLVLGLAAALGIQSIGWDVESPERAVLVRLVTIGTGIAVFSATSTIALARHRPKNPALARARSRTRLRRALPWIVILALAAFPGVLLAIDH